MTIKSFFKSLFEPSEPSEPSIVHFTPHVSLMERCIEMVISANQSPQMSASTIKDEAQILFDAIVNQKSVISTLPPNHIKTP